MTDLTFPAGFLWGTATAAHQVEGNNSNSDWWDWERAPGTACVEPSGDACDHYHRFAADIALLASLGFNTYRFSVEWARVEPSEGTFDQAELDHYRAMVQACREAGLEPMVTLNHFTLPRWLHGHGGWLSPKSPALFERYSRRVVEALGDGVTWYATLNEPGVVATGGYLGRWGFPPNRTNYQDWNRVRRALVAAHRRSRDAVKSLRPDVRIGQTMAMSEWDANEGGEPAAAYLRGMNEDYYLAASAEDDFVGVQTYTRNRIYFPAPLGPVLRLVAGEVRLHRPLAPIVAGLQHAVTRISREPDIRTTQMDWEYRPQAVAWTVRRVAEMFPGKDIVVTEHGIATADDDERIAFITEGLTALHAAIADGIPLRGYIHWSAMDNFEWAHGYAPTFGLIAVDRTTQARHPKPSARFLGEVARTGRLPVSAPVSTPALLPVSARDSGPATTSER